MSHPERIKMAEGNTATETGVTQPVGSAVQQAVEQTPQVPKSVVYHSPDFDPNRKDYQAKEVGHFYVYIDPKTGKEVARIPRVAGGAIAIPSWVEQEGLRLNQAGFRTTLQQYEILSIVNPDVLTPTQQQELTNLRNTSKAEITSFKEQLEQNQHGPIILEHFRRTALGFLKRVRLARAQSRYGEETRDVIIRGGRHGYYEEAVFDDSAELKELQATYGGLPTYMFEGVVQEIDKEAHGRPSEPLNPLARQEYTEIKRRREIERMKEKKYTEIPTSWGGTYIELLWPESAKDMVVSTLDFVKDRISEIGDRDAGTANQMLQETRNKVVELLRACKVRLNSDEWFLAENKEILETDPDFLRAQYFGEGTSDVLGNEKVMLKGNTEHGPVYKERFAAPFIPHHDEMYLGNPKVAYILHKIKTVKDGTYWMGHGWDVEKAREGEIADYRKAREEEIVENAATHDLFLGDDLTRGLYLDASGNPILSKDGRPIGAFEYREGGNPDKIDLRFSFDDNIERLLLDPDGRFRQFFAERAASQAEREYDQRVPGAVFRNNQVRQQLSAQAAAEAVRRHAIRVKIFRDTRESLDEREGLGFVTNQERQQRERQLRRPLTDKELLALAEHKRNMRRSEIRQQLQAQGFTRDQIDARADEIEQQIRTEMETQRQGKVRLRIWQKMQQKTSSSYIAKMTRETMAKLVNARASNDMKIYDQILWQWVKDYNGYKISFRLPRWYSTSWDRTRWNIDRSTKVLDRSLSEEEFEAMFESLDPEKLDEVSIGQQKEDTRFGFQLARSYDIFLMHDTMLGGFRGRLVDPNTGEFIGKLANDDETNKRLGLIRVDEHGNIIRDAQGKSIAVDPNRKMIRVFDVIQARLQAAIEKEAEVIEKAKERLKEAEEANSLPLIRERKEQLRDIFVNSQFVATHALKEIGLVPGKLPVWSHNFLDRSTIYAFTEVLADYGVEVARGVEISHNSKKEFYEYIERGRRALKSEYDRAVKEFMEDRYPVFERDVDGSLILDASGNPVPAVSLFSAASDWGEPGELRERVRVTSKGAIKEDSMITDASSDLSTSGGVIFMEAIPWMGDFGFYPLLVWMGVTDIREIHGLIRRRNEAEYHQHRFLDVMDPVNHARAQAAAYIARIALTGGKIDERTTTPGFLMEPFHGAFKIADFLYSQVENVKAYGMNNTYQYLLLAQEWRKSGDSYSNFPKRGELENLRQLSYLEFDKMSKAMSDTLYKEEYDVLDYFQLALKAAKEVVSNRIGNAPRNWVEENTRKWYRLRRSIREAVQTGDRGFISRHGYAPEVANEISISMMETVLADADYLILRPYERERRVRDGSEILSRALTKDEREKGFVIPDEKDWPNQPERKRIRLALENIRRRGLLEFMSEEGYELYDVDDKGYVKRDKNNRPITVKNGKKILGRKIPVLVREKMVKEDRSGKTMMLAGT